MDPFSQIRDEFVEQILGIQNPFYSNTITALLFLALILFLVYSVKMIIKDRKAEKKSKKTRMDFEKNWVNLFNKENSKNKK
jgi:flagellar biogenesis protein FliO